MSGLQEFGHINNTVDLIFRYFQCLHLMHSEVVWLLVFSGTQFQPQIILQPDYLPDCFSVSYDYAVHFHKISRRGCKAFKVGAKSYLSLYSIKM